MLRQSCFIIGIGCFGLLLLAGCGSSQPAHQMPRPVTVLELTDSTSSGGQFLTGSVGSWKTEDIGFEVGGRVRWVIEPDQDILGRVYSGDDELIAKGSELAKLDDERYQLAVASAKAEVETAQRKKEGAEIELAKAIPARIESAQAQWERAKAEYLRQQMLFARNSASQAEVDKAKADAAFARANLDVNKANLKVKEAEIRSLEAQLLQAQQKRADAERNLRECVLCSSFRGQVAEVHVVPGSVVAAGQRVLTVQMMDPIKVEFEVSAAVARRLRYWDLVEIKLPKYQGSGRKLQGLIYMVDTVADPATRTYTVTLLCRNRKIAQPVPSELAGKSFARTAELWPVNLDFLPYPSAPSGEGGATGKKKSLMVEKGAIHKDKDGHFMWRVTNRKKGVASVQASSVLNVEKVRVQPGKLAIPFLGNWTFVPITIPTGETFNIETDVVAGKLIVRKGDPDAWSGDKILLDREHWLMRPGDLVQVDLFGQNEKKGFFVPMSAIYEEADKTYVFAVTEEKTAKKIQVTLVDAEDAEAPANSLRRLVVKGDGQQLRPGMPIVTRGVHYLRDGELVAPQSAGQLRQ